MKRILFIGHNAGRSGAPIGLLELIRWLRANRSDVEIDLFLMSGGELEEEYRRFAEVFIAPDEAGFSRFRRWSRSLRGVQKMPKLEPFSRVYDIVVGNTIVSLDYLTHFKAKGFCTVCWVHEMEYAIGQFYSRPRFAELSGSIDRFIAVSNAVEAALRVFGVEAEVCVAAEIAPQLPVPAADVAAVRRELGLPEKAFLVGGGGTVEWRKGTDLFLQLAAMTARVTEEVYFIWVGGSSDARSDEFVRADHDVKRLGLEGRVKFTGITPEPERYLSAIDVFALTSREDPLPLICLEAAGFAKPIVCFAEAGGMPEFVADDCGFVVPYLDVPTFTEKLIELFHDPSLRQRLGTNASVKVRQVSSADVAGPRIVALIEEVAGNK